MKKLIRKSLILIALVLFFAGCASAGGGNSSNVFMLTILHTNDLHGRLENMPLYSTIVSQVRSEVAANGGNVLLLDGGDLYRRGPYQRFHGAAETEVFNAMKYDAIVFGNNEFPANDNELIDMSQHTILQMAEFSVLCGNVTVNGNYIEGIEPYIIKNMNGVNVAIIGITTTSPQFNRTSFATQAVFSEPITTLVELAEQVKDISDIRIALSHAGFNTDILMRNVNVIVGGHSHTKLALPHVIRDGQNLIPIVQAGGEEDNNLGRLDLVFRKRRGQWVLTEYMGYLFLLNDVEPDLEIQEILDKYNRR
ncbi:MAG: metallophosphoesterase [Treponema sp.]|nr:metallophosphoesterase [Treponema sp.]